MQKELRLATSDPDHKNVQPDYITAVIRESRALDFKVVLPAQKRRNPFSPVLVSVVKNEIRQLPGFLEHYRARGIQEFFILDNGSSDGTVDLLESQDDVQVVTLDRPFHWRFKQGWIHYVIQQIGLHRWFLVVDADERAVYTGEKQRDFADLAAAMEAQNQTRVRGVLVDLYAPGQLLKPRGPMRLFDGDGYTQLTRRRMVSVRGGPRRRRLSQGEFDLNPELSKYPLFRLEPDEVMANPHHLWPFAKNLSAPCHLGILHHNFSAGLEEKIERAIEQGNYWNQSIEYRAYQAVLSADPQLSLEYEGSREYGSPEDLVELGLIEPVSWRSARMRRMWLQWRGNFSKS